MKKTSLDLSILPLIGPRTSEFNKTPDDSMVNYCSKCGEAVYNRPSVLKQLLQLANKEQKKPKHFCFECGTPYLEFALMNPAESVFAGTAGDIAATMSKFKKIRENVIARN